MTISLPSCFRHWLQRARLEPASDTVLLQRFACARDEAAFAALVDRHGPMVLGVASRVVRDPHAAEDILQATFLTLTRRAGSLRCPEALPAWLHQTAYRLAVTALRARKRRSRAETRAADRPMADALDELSSRELLAVLDEELHRLPDVLRLPLVLCCLEGQSQDEAAASLGWTPGSVKGRLERGRLRLKERLVRRGLTFGAGVGAALLVTQTTLAGTLREATLRVGLGQAEASPAVVALASRSSLTILAAGWKVTVGVALAGLVGVGLSLAALSGKSTAERPSAVSPPGEGKPALVEDQLPVGAVARFGSPRLRIGNSAFALTPDGKTIVTVAPEGGVVRKFDARTGQLLERRQLLEDRADVGFGGQAQSQVTPDGRIALIRDKSDVRGCLRVWNVESGKQIFRLVPPAGRTMGMGALSSDGKLLAVHEGTEGPKWAQMLCVYDLETGKRKELGALEYNVYHVVVLSGGKRVLVSQTSAETSAQTFACFDVTAGKKLWTSARKGIEFAVSPDGKTVACASFDQRSYDIIEIDPDSGKPTERHLACGSSHPNVSVVIAPDNHTLVANHFGKIVQCDLRTGKEIHRFPLPKDRLSSYGPQLGAISPDGRTIVTNRGHLQRWDLTTGKAFFDAPPDDGLHGAIERLAFTPDGKELFAGSTCLASARWDISTRKRLSLVQERLGHRLTTTSDGIRGVGSEDYQKPHEITLFDPLVGRPLQTIRWADPSEVGINGLRAYALRADGKVLLTVQTSNDEKTSHLTACDVATGRRLSRCAVPGGNRFLESPFSPCGRWVVLAGKVYHVGTGAELFALAGLGGGAARAVELARTRPGLVLTRQPARGRPAPGSWG